MEHLPHQGNRSRGEGRSFSEEEQRLTSQSGFQKPKNVGEIAEEEKEGGTRGRRRGGTAIGAQRRRCRSREGGEVKPERYADGSSAMRAGAAEEEGGGRRAAMAGDVAEAEVKVKFGCSRRKADTAL